MTKKETPYNSLLKIWHYDDCCLPPEGLWISPDGEAHPATEHVQFIQRHPYLFSFTDRQVCGAAVGALRELAVKAILDGWIRYRYLDGEYFFEVAALDSQIQRVIGEVLHFVDAHEYELVSVSQVKPLREFCCTVEYFIDGDIREHRRRVDSNRWRFSRQVRKGAKT